MKKCSLTAGIVLVVATLARGHGVQIQITHNPQTGKIETREIVHTATRPATVSDLKRVYVMPLMSQTGGAGDGWYTRPDDERNAFNVPLYPTGPGLTYQYDDVQLAGTGWAHSGSGVLPNLQGTSFGYSFTDGLKAWNGAAFADAGSEQLQMFRGDGTSVPSVMANSTDSGPFASLALSTIGSLSSNAHHSVGFRLLGDGSTAGLSGPTAGDDGIYLASLLVTSTAGGVAPSEPLFFVMYKNVDPHAAIEAAGNLGFPTDLIQVVPEPASLALLMLSTGALLAKRTRR